MNNRVFSFFKISIKYLILALIFKYIHYLLGISFNTLTSYSIVAIIVSYFVVKYFFLAEIKKNNIERKDILYYFMCYATGINLVLGLNMLYIIFLLVFLVILKDKKTRNQEIIEKNIQEYKNK